MKRTILLTIILGILFIQGFNSQYCKELSDDLQLFIDDQENYVLKLENLIEGFNVTYSTSADESVEIFNTKTPTNQNTHNTTFGYIIGYDYWRNSDGSTSHVLLEKTIDNYILYFGHSSFHDIAPQWDNDASYTLPVVTNCFGVQILSNFTAAVDCY